jgi:hypothetical protein
VFDKFDEEAGFGDGGFDRAGGARVASVFDLGEVAGGEDGCGDSDSLFARDVVHGFAPARKGRVAEEGDSSLLHGVRVSLRFKAPLVAELAGFRQMEGLLGWRRLLGACPQEFLRW